MGPGHSRRQDQGRKLTAELRALMGWRPEPKAVGLRHVPAVRDDLIEREFHVFSDLCGAGGQACPA